MDSTTGGWALLCSREAGKWGETAKNPSHNRKVHLFLSPTIQSCIEIRASTLIY
jgi:hypothetical protein